MDFKLDGSTNLNCEKCGRKVRQTTHSMKNGVKVDYYIIEGITGKKPVVLCRKCY